MTAHDCKPAISFAGSCRIIDFSLGNIVNSDLKTALVATQYQPARLLSHIRSRWRACFARHGGSIECLSSGGGSETCGYKGTADAVLKNIAHIDGHAPRHVLVVAADHIYQMNYADMLETHVATGADVTIATDVVARRSAKGFGVVAANSRGRIVGFAEKPAEPAGLPDDPEKSLASMGIYVFDWLLLRRMLIEDAADERSSHDFGSDILPKLIARGNAFVHRFTAPGDRSRRGYWRDVGTLDALHAANMDLLVGGADEPLDLANWPLHVGWIGERAGLGGRADAVSLVYPGSGHQGASVAHSVIGPLASAGPGCRIDRSILMPGARISGNVSLKNVIVAPDVVISDPLVVGEDPEEDAVWFRRTDAGVVLIDQAMADRRAEARKLAKGWRAVTSNNLATPVLTKSSQAG